LDGVEALVAGVLYGGGLRLMEALRFRVHDVDFQRPQITVRHGKGGKDRRMMLLATVGEKLRVHLEGVRRLHHRDWRGNIPMRQWSGAGHGCSRNTTWIPA